MRRSSPLTINITEIDDLNLELNMWGDGVPRVVQFIKNKIPSFKRSYNPDTKTWTLSGRGIQTFIGDLRCEFPDAEVAYQPTFGETKKPTPPPPQEMSEAEAKRKWFAKWKLEWEQDLTRRRSGLGIEAHFSQLYLKPDAPAFIVKAVYRTLAPTVHPDLAKDDGSRMTLINASYDQLKTHFKQKGSPL